MKSVNTWNSEDLGEKYFRYFKTDISEFLTEKKIILVEDESTKIQFFKGCLPGDDKFYSSLSQNNFYYMHEKWEHHFASDFISKTLKRDAKVLDVGCGDGEFLSLLKAGKFEKVSGLEFNSNALKICSERGLDVSKRSIADLAGKEDFDVVTAFQVLEHIPDPLSFMTEIASVLKENGLIIVATPNRDSFTRRIEWDILDMPPHHVTRWNDDAYTLMASKCGLKVKEIHYEPLAAYHKGYYWSSVFSRFPTFFKLRSIAIRLASLFPMPKAVRKRIKGHTILVVLQKV